MCRFRSRFLGGALHVVCLIVTGATSGIGKAYANELARRGLDIVLVSRSKDKLHIVAKEIESQHGRQTQIIQTDFTEGHDIYPAIAEALRDLDIGILVNNVGMNYSDKLVHFLDIPNPEQRTTQVINCNILSVTQMTRLVLPRMVARGNGLIINMSSEAGAQPQPMLSLYSATKIFVTYFSRSLNSEYKSQGITVQHIALSIFFPDWLRLSSYCVKQTEKFAQSIQKKNYEMTERSASKED